MLAAHSPTMENPERGTIYLKGVLHHINSSTIVAFNIESSQNSIHAVGTGRAQVPVRV